MNIESNTTITDVANWLFAQFQTGIRPLNIFQLSNIVVFDETGNFNIICTKFVDGDQLTGIAVNHWTRNVFSFGINYDRSWFWERMATNSDMPIFESFVINPQGKNYVTLTLSNNANSWNILATNGDCNAFGGYITGTKMNDGTNQLKVSLSENRTGDIRINVLYLKA